MGSNPQVSLPGGIHDDWFDEIQARLSDFGAQQSPFAGKIGLLRETLKGGSAEKAIAALNEICVDNAKEGRDFQKRSEQFLLGAAIARIAAGDLEIANQNLDASAEQYALAIEATPPGQDALLAEALNKHGVVQYRTGHFDAAMISFRRAVKLLERVHGPMTPRLPVC